MATHVHYDRLVQFFASTVAAMDMVADDDCNVASLLNKSPSAPLCLDEQVFPFCTFPINWDVKKLIPRENIKDIYWASQKDQEIIMAYNSFNKLIFAPRNWKILFLAKLLQSLL